MIKGRRIFLRAPEPDDVEILYEWENDTSLWRYSNIHTPVSKFTIEQYVLSTELDLSITRQLRLMIVKSDDLKVIGSAELFDYDPVHLRAGVGMFVTKSEREKGYASEALDLLIDYSFNILMLKQLYCNILTDNLKSIALFTRKGFQLIGTKKQWLRINNRWEDENLYQLINHNLTQELK